MSQSAKLCYALICGSLSLSRIKTGILPIDPGSEITAGDHDGERRSRRPVRIRGQERKRPRTGVAFQRKERPFYTALTAIVFADFWASALFGRVTVRRPLEKDASIFVSSISSGTRKERSNAP
jgi:hypothetical protein